MNGWVDIGYFQSLLMLAFQIPQNHVDNRHHFVKRQNKLEIQFFF